MIGPYLQRGDFAPWFRAPALSGRSDYRFETAAGRYILMLFFGSAGLEAGQSALHCVYEQRALFDDVRVCFFGVTNDRSDVTNQRIAQSIPGIRFFLDFEGQIVKWFSRGDAVAPPHWLLLNRRLQVLDSFPLENGRAAIASLDDLLSDEFDMPAPILTVENIFEAGLCRQLIEGFDASGGESSGFMREVQGITTGINDPFFKQRKDWVIEDERLRATLRGRISRRLIPAIARAFQFKVSRIERYMVGRYEAGAGHFRPHRDNTTKGTAHRKFAVTINLNAEDYEGGDLRFPEFSDRTYRPPTGGAVVFSCSLLHEATPVTQGRRYAFLPFLYDEEGARIREANNAFLGEHVGRYSADGQ